MKDVLEIGFGLIGSGFLFVAAWKLHQMAHEFRRAIDDAAAKVIAAIPAPVAAPVFPDWSPSPVAPPVIPECRFVNCQCVRHTEPQQLLPVPMAKYGSAEIVKRSGDDWVHVGWRRDGSADLAEALTHPELAIRHIDGTIEGDSRQC